MTENGIKTVFESIAPDGSGVAGTYKVWGLTLSGIRNHEGKLTVTVIGGRTRTRKEQGMARSAVKKVEAHLAAIECPVWKED